MSMIEIKVLDRELSFLNMPTVSAGTVGVDSIKFNFSSTSIWDGYTKHCVLFRSRDDCHPVVVDADNIAKIPPNMLADEGIIHIGLCGSKDEARLTSTIVSYEIKDGMYCVHTSEDEELAKTYFEQVLEYYQEMLLEQQNIRDRVDVIEGNTNDCVADCESLLNEQQAMKNRLDAIENNSNDCAVDCESLLSAQQEIKNRLDTLEGNVSDDNNDYAAKYASVLNEQQAIKGRLDTVESSVSDCTSNYATVLNEQQSIKNRLDAVESNSGSGGGTGSGGQQLVVEDISDDFITESSMSVDSVEVFRQGKVVSGCIGVSAKKAASYEVFVNAAYAPRHMIVPSVEWYEDAEVYWYSSLSMFDITTNKNDVPLLISFSYICV